MENYVKPSVEEYHYVANVVPKPPRVHFNPIVSQLQYPSQTSHDHQQILASLKHDKNRHKHFMKHDHTVSLSSSEEAKVQKVLVTIAVAPRLSSGVPQQSHPPSRPPPPTVSNDPEVPDLLKTTPQFGRKQKRLGKARCETAEASPSSCFLENNPTPFPPPSESKRHSQEPRNPSALPKTWRAGILHQLSIIRNFISGSRRRPPDPGQQPSSNSNSSSSALSQQPGGSQVASGPTSSSREELEDPVWKLLPQGKERESHETSINLNSDNQCEGEVGLKPKGSGSSKNRLVKMSNTCRRRNLQITTGREDKDNPDELSVNVDRILEQIGDLEAGTSPSSASEIDSTQMQTEKTKTREQEFEELVKEFNAVSSALSDLTASVSRLEDSKEWTQVQPSCSFSCQSSDERETSGGATDKGSRKPPLPPNWKEKYFQQSLGGLRDQFFAISHLKTGLYNTHRPSSEPVKLQEIRLDHALDRKLSEVKAELFRSREQLSNFHPSFEDIQTKVRSSMSMIDRSGRNPPTRTENSGWESSTSSVLSENPVGDYHHSKYYEDNVTKQHNWDSIVAKAKAKLGVSYHSPQYHNEIPAEPSGGILETDLDTGTSREIKRKKSFSFDYEQPHSSFRNESTRLVNSYFDSNIGRQPAYSMQNLSPVMLTPSTGTKDQEDRSRSMDFLLGEDKQAQIMPPENELKKLHENRQPSEHELRIQRSLQRLNVPDWYKKYSTPSTPVGVGKGREFGSGTGLAGGWSGLSSAKTSSWTSLHSAGHYAGSRTQFSSSRSRGTASATPTGRSSRDYLTSPSSTASASPSPYERSSFTYGMPYALSRFAHARMSCGASPASLSPSPSPVGGISSTSTPVSGGPTSRYVNYKTPYMGWRSQERLASKSLYRSPAERLAADVLSHRQKITPATTPVITDSQSDVSSVTSPRKETASDLSLNLSDASESSSKLNRVRSSIKAVSNAIVDYVNETKPLDEINGRASPRRGLVWLESSFVGTKPIDSPGTPEAPAMIMGKYLGSSGAAFLNSKRNAMKLDHNGHASKDMTKENEKPQAGSYLSRNEKVGELSNSSSVSSPTLDDILDSLLALRRPHKKFRAQGSESTSKDTTLSPGAQIPSGNCSTSSPQEGPISDWQQRVTPLDDTMYFPQDNDSYLSPATGTSIPATLSTAIDSNNSLPMPEKGMQRYSYMHALDDTIGAMCDKMDTEKGGAVVGETKSESSWKDFSQTKKEDTEEDLSGRIAQEESKFGEPTKIPTPTIITNPLAALSDNNSNPSTPARHRRVSFDLDVSEKDEKSSSRSKKDTENIGGSIQCKNTKCGKTAAGLEARRDFKTCHNCNAYYCSRECRRAHWEKHKKVCMQSRVGQLCKQIIAHVKDDSYVVTHLSTIAKRGYLAKGRGCVKLFFSSPDRAERFLTGGLPELPEPWYIPHADMLPEEMGVSIFTELSDTCRTYNPDTRCVLYVTVCVVNEVPTSGAVKWEREMISRCSKIRLIIPRGFDEKIPHHHAATASHLNPDEIDTRVFSSPTKTRGGGGSEEGSKDEQETLILRSVPIPPSLKLDSADDRRRREVSFTNIQKHLLERGVELRRTYPDIYSKLCNYVENDEPFMPATIYPRNSQTGRQFMCVIMPESSDMSYQQLVDPSRRVETINISE